MGIGTDQIEELISDRIAGLDVSAYRYGPEGAAVSMHQSSLHDEPGADGYALAHLSFDVFLDSSLTTDEVQRAGSEIRLTSRFRVFWGFELLPGQQIAGRRAAQRLAALIIRAVTQLAGGGRRHPDVSLDWVSTTLVGVDQSGLLLVEQTFDAHHDFDLEVL